MLTLLMASLQAIAPLSAAHIEPQTPPLTANIFTPAGRCPIESDEEVVVCSRHRDRYRLPLPAERSETPPDVIGGTGTAGLTSSAPCGIFTGQRRCSKEEAALYGYGNGRDPLTVLTKLAKKAMGSGD